MSKPERMRVMMIGPFPGSPHRFDGGVASAVTYLSQALVEEPEIELIGVRVAKGRDAPVQSDAYRFPIVDLSLGRFSLGTLYRRQKVQLQSFIETFRPDLIHGQGTDVAGYLAVDCGVPAVVTVHGLLGECAKFQTNPANRIRAVLTSRLTERRTVHRAANLIAISRYVTGYYRNVITGRVHEVPNAIAPSFFQVKRSAERGRFLYAGRIANGKGLLDLLRAVARNIGTVRRLVLAGAAPDPSYEKLVRMEADKLGLAERVQFVGLLDERALLQEFQRAEVLVLPSYQETAPMVVQQAMAAGIAVLATKVGGVPDQIQDERTGLLFEAGDIHAMSRLIARVGTDPGLSIRLGLAAKAEAEARYTAIAVARLTVEVYRTILSEAAAA